MPSISATIITKNEASRIEHCLRSIEWVDEIIVFDSGSSDQTVEICKRYTPHVYITDWPGFGIQKNRAIEKASGDWILSLDADEQISDALHKEITETIQQSALNGFDIPRLSYYCGQPMHHSGWWPDYVPRLFRSGKGAFDNTIIHERLRIEGNTGKLSNPIIHYSFPDMESVLNKVNQYSSLNAEKLHAQGQQSSLLKAIGKGIWAFIRTYIIQRGFLDRERGFMLAVSNAEGTYYKYIKLYLLSSHVTETKD